MATGESKGKMIPTRILIISDTHAHPPLASGDSTVPFHHPLPAADVLIHCGDLTMNGQLSQHETAVEDLLLRLPTSSSSSSATGADPLKLVIPGNHDITLDRDYYRRFPGLHARYGPYSDDTLKRIRELYTGVRAREAGIRYLEEGVARFTLRNGARLTVYASAYQPAFCNWAFGYARSVDRFNNHSRHGGGGVGPQCPVPDHGEVDVMITHGPPKGILDRVWRGEGVEAENVGCDHLRVAVGRCRPRIHCFGHIHEAWGAVRKRWDGGARGMEGGVDTTARDADAPSTLDGRDNGTARPEREGGEDTSTTKSTQGSRAVLSPLSTAQERQGQGQGQRRRQQPQEPEADSLSKQPNPPYHPRDNPNSYYMYTEPQPQPQPHINAHDRSQRDEAVLASDETLVQPDAYADQIRQMCAAVVDARNLEFGRETLFVNASIMNLRYRPLNAPWVVDVMLPEAGPDEPSAEG